MQQLELIMNSRIPNSVSAVYNKTEFSEYGDNPLIACLPPLGHEKDVIERLTNLPQSHDLQKMSKEARASLLIADLERIFIAMPQHFELAQYIDRKIKQGYVSRNPVNNQNTELLQENYKRMMAGDSASELHSNIVDTPPSSGFLTGIAGKGKTFALKRVLARYPQIIEHPNYNLQQITRLYVDFPHDGELNTLLKNFFDAINHAIGKPSFLWFKKRESLDSKIATMKAVVIRYNIGILIIDEFQYWQNGRRGNETVISFLVSMINTIRVPVIFCGTPTSKTKLTSSIALARRTSGVSDWDPVNIDYSSENPHLSKLWRYFTNELWRHQYLKNAPVTLTDDMIQTWYELSQGIIDIAVKLFIKAQLVAIECGKERLSSALFEHVFQKYFKTVHEVIHAIKSKDYSALDDLPDLHLADINVNIAKLRESISKLPEERNEKAQPTVFEQLRELLASLGYQPSDAVHAVKTVIEENPNFEKKDLLRLALQLLEKTKEPRPKAQRRTKKGAVPDIDLQTNIFDGITEGGNSP